jgi:hypothetical protein
LRGGCRATSFKRSICELSAANRDNEPLISAPVLNNSRSMRGSQAMDFSFRCGRSRKDHRAVIVPKQFHRMQLY